MNALINRVPRTEIRQGSNAFVLIVNPRTDWVTLNKDGTEIARGYANLVSRRIRQLVIQGIIPK